MHGFVYLYCFKQMDNQNERLKQLREELVRLDERRQVVQDEIEVIQYELEQAVNMESLRADILQNETEKVVDMHSDEHPIVFAESAEDFFLHGDRGKNDEDQYCNILFLQGNFKCFRSFWGVLLGYTENNSLWEIHVDAWIRRSLMVHQKLVERETSQTFIRYAVMPTVFHDDFLELNWERNANLASGSIRPYSAWWKVDAILIPICCPDKHWFLLQYKIPNNELTIFDRDLAAVPNAYKKSVMSCYKKYILWFYRQVRNTGRTVVPAPPPEAEPFVYVKKLTQYTGSKENSALFVCIFIHYLLRNETTEVVNADISDEQIKDFRKRMAAVLYAKRTR